MNKAVHIATGIQGLTFSVGSDGVWMNTFGGGKHTSINLSSQAKEGSPGVYGGLLGWCAEMDARHRRRCEDCIEFPADGSCTKCGDSVNTTKDAFIEGVGT